MIKEGRGTLKQDFTIRYDINQLITYINNKIKEELRDYLKDVDIDDWDMDGTEVVLTGAYSSNFKSWWCSASLESPEENCIDRDYIGDITLTHLSEELKNLVTVTDIVEDDEDVDYGDCDDGPDPDRAYDEWKERHL